MRFSTLAAFVAVAASATAQTLTGQFECISAGEFTLCQNLWGQSAGVGNQNSTLLSAKGGTVSWRTQWQWKKNQNDVKSYANILSDAAKGVQLSALKSAPTAWSWTYESESSGIRADVSYDMWTGKSKSGNPASSASSYEIMIWLSGKGGIQPVGLKVEMGISLAGHKWALWKGRNKSWEVLSFVSEDGDITKFSADLKEFFDYLVKHQGPTSSIRFKVHST